ncbi:universal stress protein [Nocardia wallacei]|uniref:universal stress protein n=1 Tax=Nocardia wallacei TaxID=480035 RepID=UPI002454D250|nr:universal stress protein [Nocardia wallacei]
MSSNAQCGIRLRRHRPIVVGIDGSDAAVTAAVWAARAARTNHARLRLIHAFPSIDKPAFRYGGVRHRRALAMLDAARRAVVAEYRSGGDNPEIETAILAGHPGSVLIERSHTAGSLVVGATGAGFLSHALLGSTTFALIRDARCPVVVVRGNAAARGPVLVPVTSVSACGSTIGTAFREAADRGTDVLIADIWQGRPRHVANHPGHSGPNGVVARCRAEFPSVAVGSVTVGPLTVETVDQLTASAQLVVVGHGRADHRTTGLGNLEHGLLQHAHCPVLVLPGSVTTPDRVRGHLPVGGAQPAENPASARGC